jgi:hypothetical protein
MSVIIFAADDFGFRFLLGERGHLLRVPLQTGPPDFKRLRNDYLAPGLPDGIFSNQNTQFGNFLHSIPISFMAIWSVLQPFRISYGPLIYFAVILVYFSSFGMSYREKSLLLTLLGTYVMFLKNIFAEKIWRKIWRFLTKNIAIYLVSARKYQHIGTTYTKKKGIMLVKGFESPREWDLLEM